MAPIEKHLFYTLIGACVGSFLNVVLFRWKSGESIVFPSSHCNKCRHTLAWHQNIPILSFFLLKGRCAYCSSPISWQYPLVELATASLFFLWVFRFPSSAPGLIVLGPVFLCFLVILTVADLKWRLLPHPVNNLFMSCGLLSSWLFPSGWGASGIKDSLQAVVVLGGAGLLLEICWPGRLGGGDIKMVAGLGSWLGWDRGLEALGVAFGVGALGSIVWMVLGRAGLKTRLAFGPFLAVGGLAVVFCPEWVLKAWHTFNPLWGVSGS